MLFSTKGRPLPGGEGGRLVDHSSAWSGLRFSFSTTPANRVIVFMFSRFVMPDDLDSVAGVVRGQSSLIPHSDGRLTVPLWFGVCVSPVIDIGTRVCFLMIVSFYCVAVVQHVTFG